MNKKGFVSTSIIYSMLIVFIFVMISNISTYRTSNNLMYNVISRTTKQLNSLNAPVYGVTIDVIGGTAEVDYKEVKYGNNISFDISPNLSGSINNVSCDNNETLSLTENELTIANVISDVKCKVKYRKEYTFEYNGTDGSDGSMQTFIVPTTGYYKVELWGAEGASAISSYCSDCTGGKGAYTTGNIYLEQGKVLYIVVGGKGGNYTYSTSKELIAKGGYNGGGYGHINSSDWTYRHLYAGGGATDLRYNATTINDRIMVAAGGGSASSQRQKTTSSTAYYSQTKGGVGGELTGGELSIIYRYWTCGLENETTFYITPASQTSSGTRYGCGAGITFEHGAGFAVAERPYDILTTTLAVWGGGGGYYGGVQGSGGSSFISGHTGCIAITSSNDTTPKTGCSDGTTDNACSIHYSNKKFINTLMIAGDKEMPTFDGTDLMTGNSGNGYAKITYIGENDA